MANYFLTEDLYLNIARGLVKDATPVHILGYNPDIDTGTDPETIWSYGGVYPWTTLSVANNIHIVSSNTNDVATLTIYGLDDNYEEISESITMNGTTPVVTTKKYLRINDAVYNDTVPNDGDILFRYANTSGVVVDEIRAGYGQNTTGIYTIPDGKTGYLLFGDASCNLNKELTIVFRIKLHDSSFRVAHIAELSNGGYSYKFPVPSQIPAKTDLEVYAINATDNNIRVACNFDILLVNNPIIS